jgi:uncharacterized protein YjbI with pentapeptide repeats
MGELVLKLKKEDMNSTELDQQWKYARIKTLSALRQLDTKRKSYLIQFLYEAELIFNNRSAIDLGGVDLSGITLTGHVGMEIVYDYIALTHLVLTNTSFVDLHLMKANFTAMTLFGQICLINQSIWLSMEMQTVKLISIQQRYSAGKIASSQ